MKIKISLNKKNIDEALKKVKKLENQINVMVAEFYKACYNYFVNKANYYLSIADIGQVTKGEIQNSWHFVKTTSGAKFINTAQRAVFVEFGVGIVGERNKHPNADNTFYLYNVESASKQAYDYTGAWSFETSKDELDIPTNAIDYSLPTDDGGIWVRTYGTNGVWYAFKALEDLKLAYKELWKQIKIKYLG